MLSRSQPVQEPIEPCLRCRDAGSCRGLLRQRIGVVEPGQRVTDPHPIPRLDEYFDQPSSGWEVEYHIGWGDQLTRCRDGRHHRAAFDGHRPDLLGFLDASTHHAESDGADNQQQSRQHAIDDPRPTPHLVHGMTSTSRCVATVETTHHVPSVRSARHDRKGTKAPIAGVSVVRPTSL